ncbi:hypothetical protein H0H87_008532 [Tephrocybe sp. NHM501043]|nr:hypothetical protein H0H87_008532 [Tephrocybe sp. NHM501043]
MKSQVKYLEEKSDERGLLLQGDVSQQAVVDSRLERSHKGRRQIRKFTALLFAFISVYMLSGYLITWFIHLWYVPDVVGLEASPLDWQVPPDVTLGECARWHGDSSFPAYTSVSSFEVPISSDVLFFLSGGQATGVVNVLYGGESSDVSVEIKARYRHQEALDSVQVCAISRAEGENGVGIFGPHWRKRNGVYFEVTILLPEAAPSSTLKVKNFKTDMPLFTHEIGFLDGFVHFDSIDLKAANMPVRAKTLEAETTKVTTSNAAIEGKFWGSSSLKFVTANAPIDVQVTLTNKDDGNFTDLDIHTANGAIKSVLVLETGKETGGGFKVAATTANAPLTLSFLDAPLDSVLNLTAGTSAAPATVNLNESYEGSFSASTSLVRPLVDFDPDEEDPAGHGRKRKVRLFTRGSVMSGSVRWSDDEKELLSSVNIHTALAPVILRF